MKRIILIVVVLCCNAFAHGQYMIIQTPETIALRNIKDSAELQVKLKALEVSASDKDLNTLHTYYQMRDRQKADSIEKVAIKKFPKGAVALKNASSSVMFEKDPAKIQQMIAALSSEFPDQDFNTIFSVVIPNLLEVKDVSTALKYQKLVSGKTKTNMLRRTVSSASMIDAKATAAYITEELSNVKISENDKMALLLLQSEVLTRTGDDQKSFQSMNSYYSKLVQKTPEAEAAYYASMSKAGRQAEAFSYLEKAVSSMIGGPDVKAELKAAYIKLNPGKDAEAYMKGLEEKVGDFKMNEVAKSMIKEAAPAFSVLDANGKTVSLADFKGKTIVLDFWATWCGPCKMSLPGMQATVNKYKSDLKVAFLFIHTWEGKGKDANPTEAAKKYFAENNYGNLPLYMDLQDANKKNPAVSAFKVSAIPTKFVIDGNGNIRFRHTGASINVSEALADLSAMIELSKKG